MFRSKVPLLLKFGWGGVVALGVFAGVLSARGTAQAQTAQNFVVQVGASGPSNIDLLAFAPAVLQVHRGDTVTWSVNGFHNIRFDSSPLPLVIAPEVDGKPLPQINPGIAFPTIQAGSKYTGGVVGSGLPSPDAPPLFSLVMDVGLGTYPYLCDVHPGMVGVITVVADDQPIPSPSEVALQASMEIGSAIGAAMGVNSQMEAQSMTPTVTDGALVITAGSGGESGRATINQFFPFNAVAKVGQPVTFTILASGIEPHTVSWPPVRNQDVVPQPAGEGKPPYLTIGPSLAPMTRSGATVKKGEAFSSGLFFPDESFTLIFSEPGVYPYTCNIHPGMNGVIVVE